MNGLLDVDRDFRAADEWVSAIPVGVIPPPVATTSPPAPAPSGPPCEPLVFTREEAWFQRWFPRWRYERYTGFLVSAIVHASALIVLAYCELGTRPDRVPIEMVVSLVPVELPGELTELTDDPITLSIEPESLAIEPPKFAPLESTSMEVLLADVGRQPLQAATPRSTATDDVSTDSPAGSRLGSNDGPTPEGERELLTEFLTRLRKAGAKTGDVQISLIWHNRNDIDLHVVTPSGQRIFYARPASRCRGRLDVDANADGPSTDRPVENIFWRAGEAPGGSYTIQVHYFARHDIEVGPTYFEVMVKVDGQVNTFHGQVRPRQPIVTVYQFTRSKSPSASIPASP